MKLQFASLFVHTIASLIVRKILNNIRRPWNIFLIIDCFFLYFTKNFISSLWWWLKAILLMEQDDQELNDNLAAAEQQQQQQQRQHQQHPQGMAANRRRQQQQLLPAPEPMDEAEDDDEEHAVYVADIEEVEDEDGDDEGADVDDEEDDMDEDDDDDDDEDDAFDDDVESYGSNDEDDWTTGASATESDNDGGNGGNGSGVFKRQRRQSRRYLIFNEEAHAQPMSAMYAFQPLKLLKINYKFRALASDIPVSRSGHRVIASESHLYSLGGYNPRSALSAARRGLCLLFQELWSYNFVTNRWKLLLNGENAETMPRELASNALAIHNNVLISHGGTGYPFGESCSNDCYVYTAGQKPVVTRLSVTGDLPTAQYGPGIVIHEHYLYTIGGTTGFDYSCDVYRLNLITRVWENVYICRPEMRDDPEGRYRHEVVYDGHHIYVLGGGTSHSVYDLQKIPAFNLETNRWDYFETHPDRTLITHTVASNQDAAAGYPKPRKCFSCVQHTKSDGDIEAFITGGLQGDFTTYFGDIWKLNLRTKQWTWIRTASLPKPLYFHSAAHSGNGCMYIFGGIEYNHKEMRRRNDLYKMWMTIPKLSEICWDAITFYNEHLDSYDHDTLLSAGIPQMFINRMPYRPPQKKNMRNFQAQAGTTTLAKRHRSLSQ